MAAAVMPTNRRRGLPLLINFSSICYSLVKVGVGLAGRTLPEAPGEPADVAQLNRLRVYLAAGVNHRRETWLVGQGVDGP
jgi:hypothetical protein